MSNFLLFIDLKKIIIKENITLPKNKQDNKPQKIDALLKVLGIFYKMLYPGVMGRRSSKNSWFLRFTFLAAPHC